MDGEKLERLLMLPLDAQKEKFEKLDEQEKNYIIQKLYSENININYLFPKMSFQMILKNLDKFDFEKWRAEYDLIESLTDENEILKLLKIVLDKIKEMDAFGGLNLIDLVPYSKRKEFMLSIREKEIKQNKEIISSFLVEEYLLKFKYEDRYDVLQIILQNFNKNVDNPDNPRFYEHQYDLYLKAFLGKEMKEEIVFKALDLLIDNHKNENKNKGPFFQEMSSLPIIYGLFVDNNIYYKKILKVIIDSNYLSSTLGFREILKYTPEDKQKEVLDYLIHYLDGKNNHPKMQDYAFYKCIEIFDSKEIEQLFTKYVLEDKLFDERLALKKENFKYFNCLDYLNTKIKFYKSEEKDRILKQALIDISEKVSFCNYDEKYQNILIEYSKLYNLDLENFTELVKKFGYNILKYIENENIQNIINLPNNNFNKLLNLFTSETIDFDKNTINDVINSLLQRRFMIEKKDDYDIFSKFEMLIKNQKYKETENLLNKISNNIDINKILLDNNINYEELLNQIKIGKLNTLHIITNEYIKNKREEYLKNNYKEEYITLDLQKVISKESYKQDIMFKNTYLLGPGLINEINYPFTPNQIELLHSVNLQDELINFKKDPANSEVKPENKKYLKVLN